MFSTKEETHELLEKTAMSIVKDVATQKVYEYLKVNGIPTYCEITSEQIVVAKMMWLKYTIKPVATRSWLVAGHDTAPVYVTESMTNFYSFIYDRLYLISG